MTLRVPLWAALAACLACLAIGAGWSLRHASAQEAGQGEPEALPPRPEYAYLPAHYGQVHVPSLAEWQALRLTALGASTTRLTAEFSRQHLTCFATPEGLALTLDLLPEPAWGLYAGGGKFSGPPEKVRADLQRAVDASLRLVRSFFPEVRDRDVSLRLYLRSESVGSWRDGTLTLNAERKP